MPNFWTEKPDVWFAQVESQFNTKQITVDKTKFDYVVQSLDNSTASEVESIILHPPKTDSYGFLKEALIKAFGKTQEQKDNELLNLCGLGDRKPTALLRYIRSLNSDPTTLLRALFLSQLPSEIRTVLASSGELNLDILADQADRMIEASKFSTSLSISATRQTFVNHQHTSNSSNKSKDQLCFYHYKFREKARKCNKDSCPMKKDISTSDSSVQSGNSQASRQ